VQELVHEDFDRILEFYEFIKAHRNDFINNIVFFDKASFELMKMLIIRISDIGTLKIHI